MIRSRSLAAMVAICLASIALTTSPASSAPKKAFIDTSTMLPSERMTAASTSAIDYGETRQRPHQRRAALDVNGNDAQIVAHPAGCPRRLFCGCGVSLKVFGKAIVRGGLAIAANWLNFPRAAPASGMVAARSGHVMYIEKYLGNNTALVYDPNSGGGRTRLHVRSLAGYRVVNPHGSNHAAI